MRDIQKKSLNFSQISGISTDFKNDNSYNYFSKHTQSIANISNSDALEIMTRNESIRALNYAQGT